MTLNFCAVVFATLAICNVHSASVTPIEKVIQMLEDMKAKGIKEKQDEEVRFASFSTFCDNTKSSKAAAITKGAASLEALAADIQKADADALEAANAIAALEKDIGIWETDKADATAEREKAHADYEALHKDYSESIDACELALNVIKAGPQGQVSLLELASLPHISEKQKRIITSFLQ